MTTTRVYDVHQMAADFEAAGVCDQATSHLTSLTPIAWANRCAQFGLDHRLVIKRLSLRKLGAKNEADPDVLRAHVLRDLQRLREAAR